MSTVRTSSSIAAPPSSVALLLAGPSAAEIFEDSTALAGAGIVVDIDAPRRSGIGFAALMSATSAGTTIAWGSITVQPSSDSTSEVTASMQCEDGINTAAVRHWLVAALADLGAVARDRSTAA